MTNESRLQALVSLLAALDEELGFQLEIENLDDRVKIQKLVYFANEYGFKPEYDYSLYVHGPYSQTLAKDYYHEGLDYIDPDDDILSNMDWTAYSDLVEGRSKRWLEIAATIDSIRSNYVVEWDEPELQKEVTNAVLEKKHTNTGYVDRVYGELVDAGAF